MLKSRDLMGKAPTHRLVPSLSSEEVLGRCPPLLRGGFDNGSCLRSDCHKNKCTGSRHLANCTRLSMSRVLAVGRKPINAHDDTGVDVCERNDFPRDSIYLLRGVNTARPREVIDPHNGTSSFLVVENDDIRLFPSSQLRRKGR